MTYSGLFHLLPDIRRRIVVIHRVIVFGARSLHCHDYFLPISKPRLSSHLKSSFLSDAFH